MKILILGSTGRTGKWLVREAINRGHHVHALVRNPAKLSVKSEKLITFSGSPLNEEEMNQAMEGCEAILIALNISRKSDFPWAKVLSPENLLSETMKNIIEQAPEQGIKRVITITAAGVGDSAKYLPGWFSWIIRNSNIGVTYRDHERQEKLLMESKLDWTIVRPVGLSNSEKDKPVKVTIPGVEKPGFTISRKNVARFMIDSLEKGQYIQETPTISE